jgi:hypothetical protein
MARSLASALPARPSVLHRCTSSRRCGNCGRTGSRRPGGGRTPRGVRTLVDRRGHVGCPRPGSRRCCSPSHPGRWAQASFLNAGAVKRSVLRESVALATPEAPGLPSEHCARIEGAKSSSTHAAIVSNATKTKTQPTTKSATKRPSLGSASARRTSLAPHEGAHGEDHSDPDEDPKPGALAHPSEQGTELSSNASSTARSPRG